jgi:hypothetical protein
VQKTPKTKKNRLIFLFIAAVGIILTAIQFKQTTPAREIEHTQSSTAGITAPASSTGPAFWQALHETGNFEEYSWWQTREFPNGTLSVVTDPTGSGRGFVLRSEITRSASSPADSHRLYPVFALKQCYQGSYSSSFYVWADLPPHSTERGWISFATYSNQAGWKDLFGVNLGHENGRDCLVLFHVPEFGKGDFTRFEPVPFPMKEWVTITVKVDQSGIMLLQNDRLVAEAKKNWGPNGVSLCEAHWGLYSQGKTSSGILLNDNISIAFDRAFPDNLIMIRPDNLKTGTTAYP